MQNAIQKFRQSSIVFEKPGILPENLKTLTSSNYPTVQYFLLKLINNSRSKQNKKSDTCFCRHYFAENVCKVSAKNIKIYGSWSLSKFSIF